MTSVTLARPANIPYTALYVDGDRMLSSGYRGTLDLDDVLISIAMQAEGPIWFRAITVEETDFDPELNTLPEEESQLRIVRVDYEVDGRKVGVA